MKEEKIHKQISKLAKLFKKKLLGDLQNVAKGKQIKGKYKWFHVNAYAEYLEICNLCINKKYLEASQKTKYLETSMRDEFPNRLWNLFENYY